MERIVTMCVIDDIKTVVNGITTRIPWERYGIEVVGAALDGAEGLALIREKKPDIVVTDIRMPGLSGIEMVKLVDEGDIPSKIIFISGYTDFNYAQEAVKLGAFDYLLKPFTPQQVIDAVAKARDAVLNERSRHSVLREMERQFAESMPHLRQEFCRRLLRYDSSLESLNRQWGFLQMEMAYSPLLVMVAEIDNFEEKARLLPIKEIELARFAVQNVLEETLASRTKFILMRENVHQFVAVLNPPADLDTAGLLELCRENIDRWTSQSVSIGIGSQADTIQSVYLSYEQAKAALSYSFYSGGNCVLPYTEKSGFISPRFSADKEKELLFALRSGNQDKAAKMLDDIFMECSQYPVPPEPAVMTNLLYGLAFSIFRALSEQVSDDERRQLETKLAEMKEFASLSLSGWQRKLQDYCAFGCGMLANRQNHDAARLIVRTKTYIEDHIEQSLTVNDCAKSVHLSPSYFANLFKKETGMTLMQYVTQQRMEKAKAMLADGLQVQEIAAALGYEDRPYFSELFKKHTGLTPTEYRNKK